MARLSLLPRDRDLLRPLHPGRPEHAARRAAAPRDAQQLARRRRPRARDPEGRAGGRPDHPRHRPAPQLDLRHPDRPRGHLRRWRPRSTTSSTTSRRPPTSSASTRSRRRWSRRRRWPTCSSRPASSSPRRSRTCAASRTSTSYWIEIHRLENDGDRISRDAVASLFANGIDPMVVIRWKDIFAGARAGDRRDRDGRPHPRGHRDQERVSRMHDDVVLVIVVGDGAGLRLHQRLPRHRQRRRDLDLDPRDARRGGGRRSPRCSTSSAPSSRSRSRRRSPRTSSTPT